MNVILTLLYYTVKMSTPLLFVIMGGVFVQRAGVFNFALESAINTGAFAAIAVIMVTNNLLAGIIGALLARGHAAPLAATLGVWLHALAGLRLAGEFPLRGNGPHDIANILPRVLGSAGEPSREESCPSF